MKDALDAAQDAVLVVEATVCDAAASIGADGESKAATAIHVVKPILSVVLDHKNHRVSPIFRMANGFHNLAQRKVVVGRFNPFLM